MKKLRTVLALCIGALLLSSCSLIPQSKGPVAIAKSKIPFGLLDKNKKLAFMKNGRGNGRTG